MEQGKPSPFDSEEIAVTHDPHSLPPDRDLPVGHFADRRDHLLRELEASGARGGSLRGLRLRHMFVAAAVLAAVAAAPALGFGRGLFGFLTVLAGDAFRAGPTSIALGFGRLIRDDARPLLRALTMPVLLLWGEHDPLVPVIYAKAMLREIPNARLEIVPQASHIPMWENAEAFNHSLLTFLSNISDDERGQARSLFAWPIRGWHEGIAHREAGRWRDVVLLHGLGMSSAYFARFARALFDRGWSPVAPDLRGFGESSDGPPASPNDHAIQLAAWADAIGIRNAVWVGHSIGCNVVAHLSTARPDLVRKVICIGALWSPRSRDCLSSFWQMPSANRWRSIRSL